MSVPAVWKSLCSSVLLLCLFVSAGVGVLMFTSRLPHLHDNSNLNLRFPRSGNDVILLHRVLHQYYSVHPMSVLLLFSLVYIFFQSFAIPGTVFLSMLAGPLFGVYQALIIVTCVATIGSCCCYWLSWCLAADLLYRCCPSLLARTRQRLRDNADNLLYYLLFLRISPLLPNWFINLSSAHLQVPFTTFIIVTLIGLLPANYLHIQTGIELEQLSIGGGGGGGNRDTQMMTELSASTWSTSLSRVALLLVLASLALLPTCFKRQFAALEQRFKASKQKEQ